MRSIAIGAIVLGNLVGAGVTGCIFGDGGGGGTTALCDAICDCFGAQIGPDCPAECAADFPMPSAECVSCATRNANNCQLLEDECEAPCTGGPPPMTTLQQACQIVCNCNGNPADCQASCETAYGSFSQACFDCIGEEGCNADTVCAAECQ